MEEHWVTQVKTIETKTFLEMEKLLNRFFSNKWVTASPIFPPLFEGDYWHCMVYYKIKPNIIDELKNSEKAHKNELRQENTLKPNKMPVQKKYEYFEPLTKLQRQKLISLGYTGDLNETSKKQAIVLIGKIIKERNGN
jgi:hypothetical protein